MSRNRRKKGDEGDAMPTAPGWMATFADMMTLLMCFFVLIMSFSTMEVEKFKLAMGSLQGAFGVLGSSESLRPEMNWVSPFSPTLHATSILEHIEKLRALVENNDLQEEVDLFMHDGEVYIQIKDRMLFEGGSAVLRPNYLKLLSILSQVLFANAKEITVEGHTDNIPINTAQFPSNWELSMARALSVVRFFINEEKIDPRKLAAAGFGEFSPIVPNDTPENRAKNRRVLMKLKF